MKLPARLGADALTLVDTSSCAVDAARLGAVGWRRADPPRDLADLSPWRAACAAVRRTAEDGSPDEAWCCALDPVRLVADMRDVRLVEWPLATLDADAADALLAAATALLRDDPDPRLRRLRLTAPAPSRWYLAGDAADALHFELASPDALFGHPLRAHKPGGADAALVQRLMTELQMLFHGIAATRIQPIKST